MPQFVEKHFGTIVQCVENVIVQTLSAQFKLLIERNSKNDLLWTLII
jgi:hypothetical protein